MPVYTAELFDRYPPPPELADEMSAEDVLEIRSLFEGKEMSIAPPSPNSLAAWRLDSYEQYAIYDAYACCRFC